MSEPRAEQRRFRIFGTREFVVAGTPYLVPYRVQNEAIHILRVYHGARRWPDAF
ncbi:type II toxin-antitoxin system RelE/ParE family toxin [Methylosinus sp. LW4]|uniref:type II toxin-antitoxin system RelE/ParE family toxin n=1 Tax=Methylosinus sp. LW4 TaxID=136993 RepID=UPI000367C9F1|nr:type II toxin-antitoxin system RelE/ParE family toxin [Methylosinus sp. LW4]